MAKSLSQQTVRAFALIGARARLESLQAEIDALRASFPELVSRAGGTAACRAKSGRRPRRKRRRRRKMTAEQKQAVSDRMRKYWASRRKDKGK